MSVVVEKKDSPPAAAGELRMQRHPERSLPRGWRWARLGDITSCVSGAWGEDSAFDGCTAMTVIGTSHISNDGLLDVQDAPTRYLHRRDGAAIALTGDLLVVKSSGSAANIRSGKTALCPVHLSGKIACANFLMRLIPDHDLVDSYLLWR